MGEENPRKRPLVLDWNVVLTQNDDEETPSVVIVKNISSPKPLPTTMMMNDDLSPREDLTLLSDRDLNDKIERQRENVVKLGNRLRDKGAKLKANLKALKKERERRKFRRAAMDVDKFEISEQSTCSNKDGFREETKASQDHSQPKYATILIGKMEEKPDCRTPNVFDKDLSTSGRYNHQNPFASTQKRRQNSQSSERAWPFRSASSFSCNRGKRDYCNGNQNGNRSSPRILHNNRKSFGNGVFNEKDDCQVLHPSSSKRKKDLTVVLVDEEEVEDVETMEQANQLHDECMKNAKIYYPSRNDPDSAEICYEDIQCLAPEGFITSPVMNFYIRYLWMKASPTNRAIKDCHFFNTFFYRKLTEAVSYKGSDQETYFRKFRRWWRGISIFEKAYIFIPVHENLHWSLAIICIPDKEDDSGPVILHLDSLRLHHSKSVFRNIKSFLRKEWSFVNLETHLTDLPVTDRIWKHLPRRTDERVIPVPQQKNDYDCGLFVLFFMQRFIEEAPERLKKKDLAMFGNRWFRPEEASGLREKIRNLLVEEFRDAIKDKNVESTSDT